VEVGRVAGVEDRAATVAAALRGRLAAVRAATAGRERPRVLALEWSDPPFAGGHWVPDMVAAAGGDQVLGSPGGPSRRLGWDEIGASGVDQVVFMPCGYHLDQAVAEGRALAARPELAGAGAIWAVDASSSFSRPGPRLVDGVEALAAALHPGSVADPPPGLLARVR
jgi:iron complex transport system substrate-binding protein